MSEVTPERLMVLFPAALSDVIQKGEITDRYFNPGNLFNEVHIVLTNDDQPDPEILQKMVGNAQLFIHNLPTQPHFFLRTLGWRPLLMRKWTQKAVDLCAKIKPQLIRCHGASINAFAASEINRNLGIPYVISMHINPDEDLRYHPKKEGNWQSELQHHASVAMEKVAIKRADCLICVYKFIERYAKRYNAGRTETIYNVINPTSIIQKTDYNLPNPVRLIIPGRQFSKKDATPVIEAIAGMKNVHCLFVGDGPYHEKLKNRTQELGCEDRCEFLKSIPNDELCRSLKDFDALISVNEYGGVSKVELEAAFAAMPIITNAHPLEDEPEILGQNCITVDGSASSYATAINTLMADKTLRERLGTRLQASVQHLTSEKTEKMYSDLYREIIENHARVN
jgi:glycosyltransferase involved in cell wall biosynthesis